MADRRQNRRNNSNKDEDYNPKFRKMRKKVCPLCANKKRQYTFIDFLGRRTAAAASFDAGTSFDVLFIC